MKKLVKHQMKFLRNDENTEDDELNIVKKQKEENKKLQEELDND